MTSTRLRFIALVLPRIYVRHTPRCKLNRSFHFPLPATTIYIAAREFLTSPALLKAVHERRPSAKTKNAEVVLSAEIINGEPGRPSIAAVYFR